MDNESMLTPFDSVTWSEYYARQGGDAPVRETAYWHPELRRTIKTSELKPFLAQGWYVCGSLLRRPIPKAPRLPHAVMVVSGVPSEIWCEVLGGLDFKDLTATALTCRQFGYLSQWLMIQFYRCGVVEERGWIPVEHIPSLVQFAERWPEHRDFLYHALSREVEIRSAIVDLVLCRKRSELRWMEIYAYADQEDCETLWMLSPQPGFLLCLMKECRHPVGLLRRALQVLLSQRPTLDSEAVDHMRTLARELYTASWYTLQYHTTIVPTEFDVVHYETIRDVIGRLEHAYEH